LTEVEKLWKRRVCQMHLRQWTVSDTVVANASQLLKLSFYCSHS